MRYSINRFSSDKLINSEEARQHLFCQGTYCDNFMYGKLDRGVEGKNISGKLCLSMVLIHSP